MRDFVFKVGDYVTVREDLQSNTNYPMLCGGIGVTFVSDMLGYTGQRFKVVHILEYGYRLEGIPYTWSDEMFVEGINKDFYVRCTTPCLSLTRGRMYQLLDVAENDDYYEYRILDDDGDEYYYNAECFEPIYIQKYVKKKIFKNIFGEFEI